MKTKIEVALALAALSLFPLAASTGCSGDGSSDDTAGDTDPNTDADTDTDEDTGPALGDLIYTVGGTELGVGQNSSGTADAFIDCTPIPFARRWLPAAAQRWVVAMGMIEAPTACGSCVPTFHCTPGETITISTRYTSPDTPSTPSAFDAGASYETSSRTATCGTDGTYVDNQVNILPRLKVTFTSDSGTDTEYLECPNSL